MRANLTPLILFTILGTGCGGVPTDAYEGSPQALSVGPAFPSVIPLPDGFWPEGIDFGRGTTFYVGSLATGAIWRGDARTGTGGLLVPEQPGLEMVGLKYDARGDRLFVAGGFSGLAFVYDATSGAQLAAYALGAPGASLVNDVVVLRDAAYFTDSFNDVLYRIPLTRSGGLPPQSAVEVLPLTGDFESVANTPVGNANGIVATPDGRQLIIVNTTTGVLYRVDPQTGVATEIDVSGGSLEGGDGMLLIGKRLYVVLGHLNAIAEVVLSPDLASGEIVRLLTSPNLQFPSTIARLGNTLYAVNARFDVTPGPDVQYDVITISR